jgi:hypothetical protein
MIETRILNQILKYTVRTKISKFLGGFASLQPYPNKQLCPHSPDAACLAALAMHPLAHSIPRAKSETF